ncbi:E3 ubiquitin-protein ligase HUWE1-like [Cyanocitta cristata]
MRLGDFVAYLGTPRRERALSVCGLEFSDTRLSNLVQTPRIVRKLSWVENLWPGESARERPERAEDQEFGVFEVQGHPPVPPQDQEFGVFEVQGCHPVPPRCRNSGCLRFRAIPPCPADPLYPPQVQEFGVCEVRDLKPNGANVLVTEENKKEYVHLVCQMRMTGAIRKQLAAFLEGFYEIIPKRLISIFTEQELELLISGLPTIDIDDLKANTEYHKYQGNSIQIQWFWRALRSFDQADRAKFLQFVTGTSKVPLQGFAALEGMNGIQKFQIHRDDRSTDRLPSAHTCFNQLDLPAYESYEKLRHMLLLAIQECSEGFGLA